MKYLFVVQGEGRGHMTQALALADLLRKHNHEVVEVLVGKCSNRELPGFFHDKIGSRVRTFDSPSLDYGRSGKKGKIAKSFIVNTTPIKISKWSKSLSFIQRRVEKTKPDVIINFYELLVGFTKLLYRLDTPIISIAHQFLIDHPDYKYRSSTDHGQFVLRQNNALCSFGTTKTIALSLYPLKDSYRDRIAVLPPLLRPEVFQLEPKNDGHILGYMLNPAYMDDIIKWHKKNPEITLHIFWDKKSAPDVMEVDSTMTIHKINDTKFLKLMESCQGYITTSGFESVCEALYLGKPILMVPAHLEQKINAIDALGIGAGIIGRNFNIEQLLEFAPQYSADTEQFKAWVNSAEDLYIRHLTTLV